MNLVSKIERKMRAKFSPAENDLNAINSELQNLKKEMEAIEKMENKVRAIIRLFQVISPLQDKGGFGETILKLQRKNYGQLDQIISALEVLQKHFTNAGRVRSGLNRTEVGEEVTPEKVFLGDVFGIWTNKASYWLENQAEFEKQESGATPKPGSGREYISVWYCINDYQAGGFVKSHTKGILEQLAVLKIAS
ncbi:MAG: hypothetical protein KBB86_03560 [Candidatus Pacebacteria bacterium]|nr:hypothetical protein [Candidatus Paceibacterota bacterium]